MCEMLSSLLRLLIQIDNLFIAVVDCLQDQFVQMCTFLKNRNCRVVMAGDCQPVGTAAFSLSRYRSYNSGPSYPARVPCRQCSAGLTFLADKAATDFARSLPLRRCVPDKPSVLGWNALFLERFYTDRYIDCFPEYCDTVLSPVHSKVTRTGRSPQAGSP